MSHKNSLGIFDITEYPELLLTELENCMIARNLIFMKIFKLPKSRMAAVKDRIVNVPINEEDIKQTLRSFPRTPTEAGIIPVKLKRKQNFKNTHIEEYISIHKIKAALKTLKNWDINTTNSSMKQTWKALRNDAQQLMRMVLSFCMGQRKVPMNLIKTLPLQ